MSDPLTPSSTTSEGREEFKGHTPGPWWYSDRMVLGGPHAEYICEVTGAASHPSHTADAFLIAAAPDLFRENTELRASLTRIEAAVRLVCPVSDEPDLPAYVCLDEEGNPAIEADTISGVIAQLAGCWDASHARVTSLRASLTEAQAQLKAVQSSPCPHCHLPAVMPERCTPELNAVIDRGIADAWAIHNHGVEAAAQLYQDRLTEAQAEIERLKREVSRLDGQCFGFEMVITKLRQKLHSDGAQ